MNKRAKGSEYEERAAAYLRKNGIVILDRNFRCRSGEIDIVGCSSEKELVFFEVKYRRSTSYGGALDAVDLRKQQAICAVSDFYRISHRQYAAYRIRFDVVAFQCDEIIWVKNAFDYIGKSFF